MDHRPTDQFAIGMSGDSSVRGRPRDSLLLTAQLLVPSMSAPVQVRVRNLSAGGLMAEYAGPVVLNDAVEIEMRGVGRISGTIAWVTEGRVGIAFNAQIDPMLARKPVKAVSRPAPKRGFSTL